MVRALPRSVDTDDCCRQEELRDLRRRNEADGKSIILTPFIALL